ncbi:hypothetical protein [Kitasatospora sp. GAS1066B]|uniref:hypothetical protein n=1 Tax=Kitasatospora sp. GAS1066B TaxID=3156271 RepID=UPI0035132FC8
MNQRNHRFDPAERLARRLRHQPVALGFAALLVLALVLALALGALVGVLLLVLVLVAFGWLCAERPALGGQLFVEPAFGGQAPECVLLTGRSVLLSPRLGGAGRVHGRRRWVGGRFEVSLRIRYSPDGSAARASAVTCAPGSRVVVGGTAFRYDEYPADSVGRDGWPR